MASSGQVLVVVTSHGFAGSGLLSSLSALFGGM
jgi:mannose/fructose-specific phosphotransferase system component IIA